MATASCVYSLLTSFQKENKNPSTQWSFLSSPYNCGVAELSSCMNYQVHIAMQSVNVLQRKEYASSVV
jgi:hypothetical protein